MKKILAAVAATTALVLTTTSAADAREAVHESSPVWELPALAPQVSGASADITRSAGGVTVRFDSSGFGAHHAVTLWAIGFDHPENCTHGSTLPDGRVAQCGPGDDGAPDTGFTIQQLAGHAVGADGNANHSGHVDVANPFGAEFHIVLADHGPLDPAQLPEQIMSPAPGSQIAFFLP